MAERLPALALLLLLVLVAHLIAPQVTWLTLGSRGGCDSWDAVAVVVRVVDGDTFRARIKCASGAFNGRVSVNTEYRVRLADVNTPELGTVEGERARRALESLIQGRSVMLDLDNVGVFDRYGRIVALAYVDHNGTHLLNVNMWLVEMGHATIWDHPNEFNPEAWKLYKPKERSIEGIGAAGNGDTQTYIALMLIALITVALVAVSLLRKVKRQP